jgi:3-oxoacyl-[acyl-carrier protein] reductase
MTGRGQDGAGLLAGRHAVVTGGGSGIGRAIAQRFTAEGATVTVWDKNAAGAEETVALIKDLGGQADWTTVDVRDSASLDAARRYLTDRGVVPDILVNNAGISDLLKSFEDTDDDHWDFILSVNLSGPFRVAKALVPAMLGNGGGVVINMSSLAGVVAGAGTIAYTSAKHGLVGFTKQLAYEYGHRGLRVNAILPGAIETPMTAGFFADSPREVLDWVAAVPARRHGQPGDIAAMALFLASDESSFCHGGCFPCDGGWSIGR